MRAPLLFLTSLMSLAACDPDLFRVDELEPQEVTAEYRWVEQGWEQDRPVGQPSVVVDWVLPSRWDREVFRVYGRAADRGGYRLIATVTSCGEERCRYVDLNVRPGEEYDYYVATVDEREEREYESRAVRGVYVPARQALEPVAGTAARALDGAVWLRWQASGAQRYRVFLRRRGSETVFFELGETDGTSFLDTRAQNGERYGYQVAAVDTLGHTGPLGALVTAVPRPDYHAELIYSSADSAAAAGFRFVATSDLDPIVASTSPAAQWRLDGPADRPRIVPLGSTRLSAGEFTSALTCGPGSDPDCVAVEQAGDPARLGGAPVEVRAGHTYIFQVNGPDGRARFGKVRVQGATRDGAGRTLLVFDWAYQPLAGEPSLQAGPSTCRPTAHCP